MPLKLYARRVGSYLVPTDAAAEDELRRLPELKIVRVQVIQERSGPQNRMFWALCQSVAEALQASGLDYATKDYVADAYKIETGHCRPIHLGPKHRRETGQRYGLAPRSIDFDSMDHWAFCDFMDGVVRFTVTELLPHLPPSEVRERVESILDDEARAAWREHRKRQRGQTPPPAVRTKEKEELDE